jgi:hypothetical protein
MSVSRPSQAARMPGLEPNRNAASVVQRQRCPLVITHLWPDRSGTVFAATGDGMRVRKAHCPESSGWQLSRSGSRRPSTHPLRTVALSGGDGRETGPVSSSGSASAFSGFRFPREVICDRGPLVPALRAVLPRRRRTARRTRCDRGSRHRLPVGAADHRRVHRGRPSEPARVGRPLVRR